MTSPLGYWGFGGSGGGGAVSSVAGKTGAVTLVAADVSGVPVAFATQSKTVSFTAAAGVAYMVDTTGGAVTATLPAANVAGQQLAIKLNAGTTAITVNAGGTDTIGVSATTASITLTGEVWEFVSSGAGQWNLVAGNKSLTSLDGRYPQRSNNLSDLASASTARTNLGLGGAAVLAVGTTAGTVAAGDDSRITGAAADTAVVHNTGAETVAGVKTFSAEPVAPSLKVTGTTGAPNAGRFVGVTTAGAPTSGTYGLGDYCLDRNGQLYACTAAGTPGTWVTPADVRDALATGEETKPRLGGTRDTSIGLSTGALRLSYFTARKTETITQARMMTGGTAAGATPTLIRIGIWTVDANAGLTGLVASTTSDTTLFAGTNTVYAKSFAASWSKTAGVRYAAGVLVVTAATAPQMVGAFIGGINANTASAPRLSGAVFGQSDLPSTVGSGSITNDTAAPYFEVLP